MSTFVALDFETANHSRNSACALGLVLCRDGRIARSKQFLIRPPTRKFFFSYIHGIEWNDVARAPHFGELWPAIEPHLAEAEFLVAHNAPFDRGVLRACCDTYGVTMPALDFRCTVRIARHQWNLYPTRLPDVCRHLQIPLQHHDAGSDAEACARIVLAAIDAGWTP